MMTHPIPAAIAVVVHNQQVLLVKRANPPDAGYWGFPGGKINRGESLQAAAVRELFEETGVRGHAEQIITALDAFSHAPATPATQHFILIAVLCRWVAGSPAAGDDALEAQWFTWPQLHAPGLLLSQDVARVASMGFTLTASEKQG